MKKLFASTIIVVWALMSSCDKDNDPKPHNDCIDAEQAARTDWACPQYYDPVCGCDNVTYSNGCMAGNSGVKSSTKGACGSNP